MSPSRCIRAAAPTRICDIGGWTDTWFAGHGKVFNLAVFPTVDVTVNVHRPGVLAGRVALDVENDRDHYSFEPGALPGRFHCLRQPSTRSAFPMTSACTSASPRRHRPEARRGHQLPQRLRSSAHSTPSHRVA